MSISDVHRTRIRQNSTDICQKPSRITSRKADIIIKIYEGRDLPAVEARRVRRSDFIMVIIFYFGISDDKKSHVVSKNKKLYSPK